jgi:cation transport ATPase
VNPDAILHETRTRLRLQAPPAADLDTLRRRLAALPDVASVRLNQRLRSLTVAHDGRPATRAAVLASLVKAPPRPRRAAGADPRARTAEAGPGGTPAAERAPAAAPGADPAPLVPPWATAALASLLPLLPGGWRPGAALGLVAARIAGQRVRLRQDAPAVWLDAASLASLAVSGQPLVVSASVLLRLLAESLSGRMLRQTEDVLAHVLPELADRYRVLRGTGDRARTDLADGRDWPWLPLRRVRAGDRLRLFPGDVVPVDGCIADGQARLHALAPAGPDRDAGPGARVVAGERLLTGTIELRAESDAAGSRLARLQAQIAHAIGARDPVGRLAPDLERLMALPLTGAALVLGLTGDRARAAAMLQADPQQGLDLALPVAREAAMVALARHGLVVAGLEAIERLATARVLVLQDTGVLADGRWTVEAIDLLAAPDEGRGAAAQAADHAAEVRRWLAALAGLPETALSGAGLPDERVREWVRHGAVLPVGDRELHLAAPARLREVWGLSLPAAGPARGARATAPLWRHFAVVAAGRVVARVTLVSALRQGVAARLAVLRALGVARVAVAEDEDGGLPAASRGGTPWRRLDGVERLPDDAAARAGWLADAVHDGGPALLLHSVLRDLVPPGSLSLTPAAAGAGVGAHGVLLGDPLDSLVTARRLAQRVHRRLRRQQGSAVGANALLMTASALRWLPPMAIALLHHGFALAVLLDSLRVERLDGGAAPVPSSSDIDDAPPQAAPTLARPDPTLEHA